MGSNLHVSLVGRATHKAVKKSVFNVFYLTQSSPQLPVLALRILRGFIFFHHLVLYPKKYHVFLKSIIFLTSEKKKKLQSTNQKLQLTIVESKSIILAKCPNIKLTYLLLLYHKLVYLLPQMYVLHLVYISGSPESWSKITGCDRSEVGANHALGKIPHRPMSLR